MVPTNGQGMMLGSAGTLTDATKIQVPSLEDAIATTLSTRVFRSEIRSGQSKGYFLVISGAVGPLAGLYETLPL